MHLSARTVSNALVALSLVCIVGVETAEAARRAYSVGKSRKVTIHTSNYREELQSLVNSGYDVAGVNLENNTIDVIADEIDFANLTTNKALRVAKSVEFDKALAPDAQYTDYAELTAILQKYAEEFPSFVKLESYGKSREGRDLWAVKITEDVNEVHQDRPVVFFNGMHHAREVMTTEVALDLIEVLVKGNDAGDERIRQWVGQNQIWVVPMVNPDGNNKVWTGDNMWRKNTRDPDGVDINRNYPYKWGACNGSSGSVYAQNYRGPSAASEPETQAMMEFVGKIKPVMSISYHSYSELVIYPMSCSGEHAPDRETVEGVGKKLASLLKRDSGSGTYQPGTSWEILYGVDGGDIDWMYDTHDVLPYVIEVNSTSQGFQPRFSWRQKTVEKMRPGWQYFLDRVSESGIRGVVKDSDGKIVTNGQVSVEAISSSLTGKELSKKIYKIKPDGTFHVILNPGMYRVHVVSNGRNSDMDVTVGAKRSDIEVNF